MSQEQWVCHKSLVLMFMTASGILATGCVDSAQSAATDQPERASFDEYQISAFPMQGQVRYTRTSQGEAVSVTSPGWAERAPGIWGSAVGGAGSLIVGPEGHRTAIVEAEQRLAFLRRETELGHASHAAIEQQAAYLDSLREAEHVLSGSTQDVNVQATCTMFSFVGPLSLFIGGDVAGVAAAFTVQCTEGLMVFTAVSTVCSDLVPCRTVTQTAPVATAQVIFGQAAVGSLGALCSGEITLTPPGLSDASAFSCF